MLLPVMISWKAFGANAAKRYNCVLTLPNPLPDWYPFATKY
jgi:hypothetical protein